MFKINKANINFSKSFLHWINSSKPYLESNFTETHICFRFNVSKGFFRSYLKRELNTSFPELIHTLRIDDAMRQAEANRRRRVWSISKEVGYKNMFQFLFWFWRVEHKSYFRWRKENGL